MESYHRTLTSEQDLAIANRYWVVEFVEINSPFHSTAKVECFVATRPCFLDVVIHIGYPLVATILHDDGVADLIVSFFRCTIACEDVGNLSI